MIDYGDRQKINLFFLWKPLRKKKTKKYMYLETCEFSISKSHDLLIYTPQFATPVFGLLPQPPTSSLCLTAI